MRRIVLVAALALLIPAAASASPVFIVSGRGWGHGVGMSQYGAQGFAAHGWRYGRILAHYYPGTRLERVRPREVRVLLAAGRTRVTVSSRMSFRLVDARGRKRLVRGRLALGPKLRGLASPVRVVPGAQPVSLDGRPYRGALVVRARGGRMSVVNAVTLERYLRGVVPYEMPHDWHPQALRAQAVVARSYTLATLRPGKLFDLYDDQRSQVYGGVRAETVETNLAVGATANQVLTYAGRIATTYYHSTSGGRTANVADVWSARIPYLRGVADPYDSISPHHRWGPKRLDLKPLGVRGVRDLSLVRSRSGRVAEVVLRTAKGARTVEANELRRRLGLRSTWFQVGVLRLDPPAGPIAGGRVVLRGVARGVGGAVVQRRDGAGWRQVVRVRPRPDGSFAVRVRAAQTSRFRLAAQRTPGLTVVVRVAA
jgi:stage II sporulation protein D